MAGIERKTGDGAGRLQEARQPGWVVLVGMLATACLVIGLIMLAMLQAPALRRGVIVTSCAFIAAGVLLASIVWFVRLGVNTGRPAMTVKFDLTDSQRVGLESISKATGRTPQQLLSDAIDRLLEENDAVEWRSALAGLEGLWEGRHDLPDFHQIRAEMDRDVWSR